MYKVREIGGGGRTIDWLCFDVERKMNREIQLNLLEGLKLRGKSLFRLFLRICCELSCESSCESSW